MERRKALQQMFLATGTLMVVPAALASCSKSSSAGAPLTGDLVIDLTNSKYSQLTQGGGSVIVGSTIVVNTGSDKFIALSAICTHAGCLVEYQSSQKDFYCPCHGSVFSASGSVMRGPAGSPLASYTTTYDATAKTVTVKGA
ncbi:ubiquinol-cytochrome c reductase iron-sulfur subunit [Prolixibacter sp. SD074]|uniref:QcrA and Rieske domain-containing protein n=1 Tax=Prolixibacter sp. SD074 TaxID=2652391 RepID=UPI00127B2A59|nr:Rieske 2Fe-2S domain-containing protein [Prolixibacter sp. SD074]GET30245.1 hypothetical protein SD074_24470 [Prolixibacter sp. SD074]